MINQKITKLFLLKQTAATKQVSSQDELQTKLYEAILLVWVESAENLKVRNICQHFFFFLQTLQK